MKDKILNWFANGEVGASSKAMACCIGGHPGRTDHPLDPADFNRCLLFLESVPEARLRLDDLRKLSPTWDRLISRWAEVEAVFIEEVGLGWSKCHRATKTYKLMKEIGCL